MGWRRDEAKRVLGIGGVIFLGMMDIWRTSCYYVLGVCDWTRCFEGMQHPIARVLKVD